jgi:hypothetical protein
MTKPPSELPNENTRALSIQLTPIYSIENRFIASMVVKLRNKTHTTVLIINNKSRKEGVRKKSRVTERMCTQEMVQRSKYSPACSLLLVAWTFRYSFTTGSKCKLLSSSKLLLLLQSALQRLWVLACSTIVEYSQQEGFYRMQLPAARQTPNLEDQWLERS